MNHVLYYTFLHNSNDHYFAPYTSVKKINIVFPETWEHIRYLLEQQNGLHCVNSTKKQTNGSYFEGWLYEHGIKYDRNFYLSKHSLKESHCLHAGDKIVLRRRMFNVNRPFPYVPQRYRESTLASLAILKSTHSHVEYKLTESMTEDEKIMTVVDASSKIVFHDNNNSDSGFKKHIVYCKRCGVYGHLKSMCPTLNDPDFEALDAHKPVTGIPKIFLKKATTEEEQKRARKTTDGEFVLYDPHENS